MACFFITDTAAVSSSAQIAFSAAGTAWQLYKVVAQSTALPGKQPSESVPVCVCVW